MPTETFKPISLKALETLKKFDSPTICNVIELFRIRPNTAGWMSSKIRSIYPQLPPVAGYATTATFRSTFPSGDKDVYKRIIEHVEKMQAIPTPRFSVIQDLDDTPCGAVLGEVMARLYRGFGCAGIVTNGTSRDLLQVEKLNLPVFASGLAVSHAYPHFIDIHVPVNIAGLTVRPGDLLHADSNGVVQIPFEIAEHVAAACADFCDAENIIMNYLERPYVTVEKYKEVYAQTVKAIGDLGERLRKQHEQSR
jgi:4-hydroxy-4-methyl-2-oxoglutarate aldolase